MKKSKMIRVYPEAIQDLKVGAALTNKTQEEAATEAIKDYRIKAEKK